MNQLSNHGSVSNWCEQFGLAEDEKGQGRTLDNGESVNKGMLKSVNSQEVNSLVSSPRLASGNSLRENIQDFESLSDTFQYTMICEHTSFWYRVSAGMRYKTKHDEDDGCGDPILSCREYTFPRANPQPRAYAAILGEAIV